MKKCKSTCKARPFIACGEAKTIFKYGLCQTCFIKWTQETREGQKWFKEQTAYKFKKNLKEKAKKEREEKRRLKDKLNTGDSMQLADMYFSRYMRLKHSFDREGETYCTCFTSGKIIPIKQCDNGHYMKREHKATRYHQDNCRPQSKTDNGDIKHNGKQVEFREALIRQIGFERVEEVERLSKTTIKADSYFYRDISTKYRVLCKEIQKERGIKIW